MKLILGERCSGKTSYLIEKSKMLGVPIVAPSSIMAQCIKQEAEELGVDIPEPMSINKILNINRTRGGRIRCVIDELEAVLFEMGLDVEYASADKNYEEIGV